MSCSKNDYRDLDDLLCPACRSGHHYHDYLGLPMRTHRAQMLHCIGVIDLPVATCRRCGGKFETDSFQVSFFDCL